MSDFVPSPERLAEYAADPLVFFADLRLPVPGQPRLGDVWAPFQQEAFQAIAPTLLALAAGEMPPVTDFWLERTKGGSKDSDIGAMVVWLLVFAPMPLEMRAGATDFDQILELRKALRDWLRVNRWLESRVEIQTAKAFNPTTGGTLEFLSADASGSHGSRPALTLINEASHMRGDGFALTLADDADKVAHGVMLIATNAGVKGSWQWAWREEARQRAETDTTQYFQKVEQPAPWINEKRLGHAQRRNTPQRFARLWKGVWSSGEGDALDPADIAACQTLAEPEAFRIDWEAFYIAGLDLGIKRDHAAFVILKAIPLARRVQLAWCESWKPGLDGKIDLIEVQAAVERAHHRFNLNWCGYDPFQAVLMAQQLAIKGVPMCEVPFTGQSLDRMARVLIETFRDRTIDLYPDPELIADLGRLSIEERSFGYKLTAAHDETGHADRAIGLTIALPTALEVAQNPPPAYYGPDIIERAVP